MNQSKQLFVVGIDGGGTKTHAAIMDQSGKVVGFSESGPSNYDDVGVEASKQNLQKSILQARLMAEKRNIVLPEIFDAAFLGMAGVASEKDRQIIRQIAKDLNLCTTDKIGIDHDIRVALAGGLSGRPGIVVIAGTGSSCYGRTEDGRSWKVGCWAHLIADDGSGYWLGLQAIRLAMMAYDGRIPPTPLMEKVRQHLGIEVMDEVMHRLYVQGMSRSEFAAIAPIVLDIARQGDLAAQSLIQKGAEEIARSVFAVYHHLEFPPAVEIALSGGLIKAGDVYVTPLINAIHAHLPQSRVIPAELPPVIGACLLALQMLGIVPTAVHLPA